jgi:hypothetical protein
MPPTVAVAHRPVRRRCPRGVAAAPSLAAAPCRAPRICLTVRSIGEVATKSAAIVSALLSMFAPLSFRNVALSTNKGGV